MNEIDITKAIDMENDELLNDVDYSSFILFLKEDLHTVKSLSKANNNKELHRLVVNHIPEIIFFDENNNKLFINLVFLSKSGKRDTQYKYKKLIKDLQNVECDCCGEKNMRYEYSIRPTLIDGRNEKIYSIIGYCDNCVGVCEIISFKIEIFGKLLLSNVRLAIKYIKGITIKADPTSISAEIEIR